MSKTRWHEVSVCLSDTRWLKITGWLRASGWLYGTGQWTLDTVRRYCKDKGVQGLSAGLRTSRWLNTLNG